MNRKLLSAMLIVFVGISVVTYFIFFSGAIQYDDPELDFPILESENVERISAYRTPDWGEPGVFHNGIDLVISDDVTVVSPVNGTVVQVTENVNPYAGNVLFDVTVRINPAWEIHLVLEPGYLDETNNSLQSDNILVSMNDNLGSGDVVATLLHSENYPHLHYMLMHQGSDVCAYNYSSDAARTIFDEIAARSSSVICYPLITHEMNLGLIMILWPDDSYFLLF